MEKIPENIRNKRIAILAPVAWRTPPRAYGAWETVASNITEGLVSRGWRNITLFATADSVTSARLCSIVVKGYEEDITVEPKVCECLHISELMEQADEFDLIHNNFDFLPLTYSRLISTPMLTTIHGFSSDDIRKIYRKYKDSYFVSISDADRDPYINYMATVYNGIDLTNITYRPLAGDKLVFLGRIHPDKGTHLAIEVAKKSGMDLIIAGIIQDRDYFENRILPYVDEKYIQYIGSVDPIQRDALLARAYAVLHLNTIPERFGLVMAESMAAGVPVIANDLGSCREVVAHGKTGFLVNDTDEAVIAISKVTEINRFDCRMHVEQNFTIEKMVTQYEKVYAHILGRRENAQTIREEVLRQPDTHKGQHSLQSGDSA